MRKLISFAHISLDGFVCGENGEMDWIKINESMFGFVEKWLTERSDTALYGKNTYTMMESYWPTAAEQPGATDHDKKHAAWYKKANKIVLSTTLGQKSNDKLTVIADNLTNNINALKRIPGKDIVIFGSPGATRSLAQQNLIDAYWLFINPIILGKGKKLFDDKNDTAHLKLKTTEIFPSDVICCYYEK